MNKIVVIGDYMLDIDRHLRTTKIAPDHNVPVCQLVSEEVRPGGAGAVVEMLRKLGVDVLAIGENIKQKCVKHRFFIDDKPVFRQDTDFTVEISDSVTDVLVERIPKDVEYILVSDYGKGIVTKTLFKKLKKLDKKIIVDPAISRKLEWYVGAWAIVPNAVEAQIDQRRYSQAFDRTVELLKYYSHVCLKLGQYGMWVGRQCDKITKVEPIPITVVDTCGAGDMVLASITLALLEGQTWLEACEFANTMAAQKCTQWGATPVESKDYGRAKND